MNQVDTILIIDDDPMYRLLIKKTIHKYHFAKNILSFHNGQEALDALSEMENDISSYPDIIILDINMPLMDGWEFLDIFPDAAKKNPKKLSIYIATSSIAQSDKKKSEEYPHVKGFLHKPIDQEMLVKIVTEHLKQQAE